VRDGPTTNPVTVVIQTRVRPGRDDEFAALQHRIGSSVRAAPGCLSHQVLPPEPPAQQDWVIIERFESRARARAWLASEARAQALAGIDDLLAGDQAVSIIDSHDPVARTATAVILSTVEPGHEEAFQRWNAEITAAQSRRPGYVGATLQAPVEGVQDQWVTMVTFDSDANLDAWLGSEERATLVARSEGLFHDTETRRVEGGFSGWFDYPRSDGGGTPPAWKFNHLVLVGLYPIVMLEILFLNNKLAWMNAAFATLIGLILSVAFLGWPVLAVLQRAMNWWIQPGPDAPRSVHLKGAVLMMAVLIALVCAFYLIVRYVGFDAKVPSL
jgi:antibiotic biosynthesis monooxygenase (ABM) superfamily enzyme